MTTDWLAQPDPYTNEPTGAERTTQHVPTDICRWVARHKVSDCGYPKHPGFRWVGKRWVEILHAPTAAELAGVPRALQAPEPDMPWEAQP